MSVQKAIEAKLQQAYSLEFLSVENESHMHNVPANSETHFKITLVSNDVVGQRLIQRQRSINKLLADELAGPVHALAQHIYTVDEWNKKMGVSPQSPNCLGGGK
ncbi:BolA/IbaG family iron-sulfur metabolism protein [Glaciecola sp. MH2013]|uniref:BolA family protein n=1 Tax=Glaciecola sp. MH2013 TaxID=2785524 RepID=UPI0018A04295|nr:BolA/IbaG family iron-sulfur metabolism protein [Glaciecola sp. MH2013]MBF7071898.1 BolA/IbaG family iron-sulfur metabolism protein [Glaciecola sp. MH2013]